MAFVQGLDKETLSILARVPYEEMGSMIIELANLRSEELVDLIEEASRQEPPNTAVMIAAGSICVSRLTEPSMPFRDKEVRLRSGAETAFPGFNARSIDQYIWDRTANKMKRY